jgi:hypothetical protein
VAVRAQNPQHVDNAVVPRRVEPDFPASRTLFAIISSPELESVAVDRAGTRHAQAILVSSSSIRPGKSAFQHYLNCRPAGWQSEFFQQVEHFLRYLRIQRFGHIETLVRYLSYPFFDPTQLLRSETHPAQQGSVQL